MVARDRTDEEKAKLPAVTAQVLKGSRGRYLHQSGGTKVGMPMTACQVAVCRKMMMGMGNCTFYS